MKVTPIDISFVKPVGNEQNTEWIELASLFHLMNSHHHESADICDVDGSDCTCRSGFKVDGVNVAILETRLME